MTKMRDLIRFRMERDRALLTGNVFEVRKFAERWSVNVPPLGSLRSETAAMHKAIVAANTLPLAYRQKSAEWLRINGFAVPR